MILNFGKIFHKSSKDRKMRGLVRVPDDRSFWPESWKTIYYKTYDRFTKIKLPEPNLSVDVSQMVMNRSSAREWGDKPVLLQQLSNLLYYSCGVIKKGPDLNLWKRAQASAGGRYPIEVYLVNFVKGELEHRVYHYNVKEHALDVLWKFDVSDRKNILKLFSYTWAKNSGFGIFLTAAVDRAVMKYGERGYRQIYLEAGAISHMINNISGTQNIGSVIMSGTNDEEVEWILDIDGEKETLLIGIALGSI